MLPDDSCTASAILNEHESKCEYWKSARVNASIFAHSGSRDVGPCRLLYSSTTKLWKVQSSNRSETIFDMLLHTSSGRVNAVFVGGPTPFASVCC